MKNYCNPSGYKFLSFLLVILRCHKINMIQNTLFKITFDYLYLFHNRKTFFTKNYVVLSNNS